MSLGVPASFRIQTVVAQSLPRLSTPLSGQARAVFSSLTSALPARRAQKQTCLTHRPARPLTARCRAASTDTAQLIEEKNAANDVVIYSKSYCPFSGQVKQLFKKLNVEYKAFELDEIVEGEDVLDSLVDVTSSRTVPQVFIKGHFVGGCDETMSQYRSGKLQEIFKNAGIAASF